LRIGTKGVEGEEQKLEYGPVWKDSEKGLDDVKKQRVKDTHGKILPKESLKNAAYALFRHVAAVSRVRARTSR
jgi:hypothetical protein